VTCDQIPWNLRLFRCEALIAFASQAPIEAVVIESFHLYAHKAKAQIGNTFPSVQVIGIIEAFCYTHGIREKIVFQSASEIARTLIRPEHEHLLTSEHMRDAYKHARLWLIKQGLEGVTRVDI